MRPSTLVRVRQRLGTWIGFALPPERDDDREIPAAPPPRGRNFRERERIKRKLARWRARLASMPILERRVISAALGKSGEAGL